VALSGNQIKSFLYGFFERTIAVSYKYAFPSVPSPVLFDVPFPYPISAVANQVLRGTPDYLLLASLLGGSKTRRTSRNPRATSTAPKRSLSLWLSWCSHAYTSLGDLHTLLYISDKRPHRYIRIRTLKLWPFNATNEKVRPKPANILPIASV
jgi:hypothetical protein